MKFFSSLIVLCLLQECFSLNNYNATEIEQIYKMRTGDYVKKFGYNFDYQELITDDGYYVSMYRIPNPNKIPVLFVHGLCCSSFYWVINGPNDSLPFYLHAKGFDVWIADARGNFMNRKHVRMNPKQREFWKFSWHEIAIYDIPKMMDYIVKTTGYQKMHLVGHSQGNTEFFVMLSMLPELNSRIYSVQALGPAAVLDGKFGAKIPMIGKKISTLEKVAENLGFYEFIPRTKLMVYSVYAICNMEFMSNICEQFVYISTGEKNAHFIQSDTFSTGILFNGGSSLKEALHYAQSIESQKFRRYDYGRKENLRVYNQTYPPEYDLSRITAPLVLYSAKSDIFAPVKYVQMLNTAIKSSELYLIPADTLGHVDFVWGKNLQGLVYEPVLNSILKYSV